MLGQISADSSSGAEGEEHALDLLQLTNFFQKTVVDQLGIEMALKFLNHLCIETAVGDSGVRAEEPGVLSQATRIFTLLDSDHDTFLSVRELQAVFGHAGAAVVRALQASNGVDCSLDLEDWTSYWASQAEQSEPALVQHQLSMLLGMAQDALPTVPERKVKTAKSEVKKGWFGQSVQGACFSMKLKQLARDCFVFADGNCDGMLTKTELFEMHRAADADMDDAMLSLWRHLETTEDSSISLHGWLSYWEKITNENDEHVCKNQLETMQTRLQKPVKQLEKKLWFGAEKVQLHSAKPVHRDVDHFQVEKVHLKPMQALHWDTVSGGVTDADAEVQLKTLKTKLAKNKQRYGHKKEAAHETGPNVLKLATKVFAMLDVDGSGNVSLKELLEIVDDDAVAEFVIEIEGDNMISEEEWMTHWQFGEDVSAEMKLKRLKKCVALRNRGCNEVKKNEQWFNVQDNRADANGNHNIVAPVLDCSTDTVHPPYTGESGQTYEFDLVRNRYVLVIGKASSGPHTGRAPGVVSQTDQLQPRAAGAVHREIDHFQLKKPLQAQQNPLGEAGLENLRERALTAAAIKQYSGSTHWSVSDPQWAKLTKLLGKLTEHRCQHRCLHIFSHDLFLSKPRRHKHVAEYSGL